MTEAKRVSVVVPTRDRPELLREALQSIRALENDGVRFEIIVGDNGTSPDTRKVAEDIRRDLPAYIHVRRRSRP